MSPSGHAAAPIRSARPRAGIESASENPARLRCMPAVYSVWGVPLKSPFRKLRLGRILQVSVVCPARRECARACGSRPGLRDTRHCRASCQTAAPSSCASLATSASGGRLDARHIAEPESEPVAQSSRRAAALAKPLLFSPWVWQNADNDSRGCLVASQDV